MEEVARIILDIILFWRLSHEKKSAVVHLQMNDIIILFFFVVCDTLFVARAWKKQNKNGFNSIKGV